jgi:hypothetical protein
VVWNEAIHSVPFTRGIGADLPPADEYALIHHHYTSVAQYVDRLNRYTDHQLKQLLSVNTRFGWEMLVIKPAQEFLTQYFARRGFADGIHGLALAGLQAFSELVLYLKLWQQTGFVNQNISLARVNHELSEQAREYLWWYYQSRIDASSVPGRWYWKLVRGFRTHRLLPQKLTKFISNWS